MNNLVCNQATAAGLVLQSVQIYPAIALTAVAGHDNFFLIHGRSLPPLFDKIQAPMLVESFQFKNKPKLKEK